jgi:sodium/proline symporter
VVVAYTLFGGFLAVSLTDFVQGCIMFVALIMVPLVAIIQLGGLEATGDADTQHRSGPAQLVRGRDGLGLISSLSWGLGYFGQPHIIVRFMAIRSLEDVKTARRIGMSWMLVTVVGAVGTGMAGFAYVNGQRRQPSDDPETIFIYLSQVLFHPLVGGFLLAAILAAIMSTISSQLLVSSSSLTEDFYKTFVRRSASQKELVLIGRLSVLAVSVVAMFLARIAPHRSCPW